MERNQLMQQMQLQFGAQQSAQQMATFHKVHRRQLCHTKEPPNQSAAGDDGPVRARVLWRAGRFHEMTAQAAKAAARTAATAGAPTSVGGFVSGSPAHSLQNQASEFSAS